MYKDIIPNLYVNKKFILWIFIQNLVLICMY